MVSTTGLFKCGMVQIFFTINVSKFCLLTFVLLPCRFSNDIQAVASALRVEHLVWDVEAMSAGLSMGQLDTLKAVLVDQVARVDEAKVSGKVNNCTSLKHRPVGNGCLYYR